MIDPRELSNDELIDIIVDRQCAYIRLIRKNANHPLSVPAATAERAKEDALLWSAATERNLNESVDDKVNAILEEKTNDHYNLPPL